MGDYKKILERAAQLCSSSEKCRYDIHVKLISWGLNEKEAENALDYLEKNNFINEVRYAELFVKDKFNLNKWGRIKIIYGLRGKKVDEGTIQKALESIDEAEYTETLTTLLKAKMKSIGSIKIAANRAKLVRFAAQRGFTSEEIYGVLRRLEE